MALGTSPQDPPRPLLPAFRRRQAQCCPPSRKAPLSPRDGMGTVKQVQVHLAEEYLDGLTVDLGATSNPGGTSWFRRRVSQPGADQIAKGPNPRNFR